MGIIRFILAITIVFVHSPWQGLNLFVGSTNALRLFFMISGFLISYVLIEKKSYSTTKAFYINRYLRLYPLYLIVAILSIVGQALGFKRSIHVLWYFCLIFILVKKKDYIKANIFFTLLFYIAIIIPGSYIFFKLFQSFPSASEFYKNLPLPAAILLITSNITLFGQDLVMFSSIKNNNLIFPKEFWDSDVLLWLGLFVPQAWSVGVELTFYIIAPFLLPRKKLIYLMLLLSLTLRIYLIKIGIGLQDPWNYRFFPTELTLFLLGALSHQVLLPFYKKIFHTKINFYSILFTLLLIAALPLYHSIPIEGVKKSIFFIIFVAALLPFSFIFNNICYIDNWIGNLSYPIYLSHFVALGMCNFILQELGIENNKYVSTIGMVIISIILSILLNKLVDDSFKGVRNKFRTPILG